MKKVYVQYLRGFFIDKGTRYWFTDVVGASTREDLKTAVKKYRSRIRKLKPTYTKELEYSHKAEVENYHELCETVEVLSSKNIPEGIKANSILHWL